MCNEDGRSRPLEVCNFDINGSESLSVCVCKCGMGKEERLDSRHSFLPSTLLFPRRRLLLRLLPLLAAALVLLDQFIELLLVLLHRQLDVVAQRRHHILLGHAAFRDEEIKDLRVENIIINS